jgi:hypothetical protein
LSKFFETEILRDDTKFDKENGAVRGVLKADKQQHCENLASKRITPLPDQLATTLSGCACPPPLQPLARDAVRLTDVQQYGDAHEFFMRFFQARVLCLTRLLYYVAASWTARVCGGLDASP